MKKKTLMIIIKKKFIVVFLFRFFFPMTLLGHYRVPEACLEPCQTSKMVFFAKIINS